VHLNILDVTKSKGNEFIEESGKSGSKVAGHHIKNEFLIWRNKEAKIFLYVDQWFLTGGTRILCGYEAPKF